MQGFFTTPGMMALQKGLVGLSVRYQAIAYNMANVDTPGFQRVEVEFEDVLKEALNKASDLPGSSLMPGPNFFEIMNKVQPRMVVDDSPPLRADGSNVDIDQESVALAQTSGRYLALAELLGRRYDGIKMAIRESVR